MTARQTSRTMSPGRRIGKPLRVATTTVEFAIVAPIIFFFVLGAIEIGRGFMVSHMLNNAALQASRTGIVEGTSSATIAKVISDDLTAHGFNGSTTKVLVNGVESEAANAASQDKITVVVAIPAQNVSWVPGLSLLNGKIENKCSFHRE